MGVGKTEILSLYRLLLKESNKFPSYNYRNYFLRRIKDEFKMNKIVETQEKLNELYISGHENLLMIKRQAIIGELYRTNPLVIERPIPKA